MRKKVCVLLAAALCTVGCCAKNDTVQEPAEPCIQVSSPADLQTAVTGMLLRTEDSLYAAVPEHAFWDMANLLREAADSQVLARTMLQGFSWSFAGPRLEVCVSYAGQPAAVRREKQQLAEAASEWQLGTAAETDEIRVLMAHDMLCRCCVYENTQDPRCHGAYGALIAHTAVCDGYAEAFALLMEAAGIPVMVVSGTAQTDDGNSAAHAWNLVQLSGQWYHLDCTWDDTGGIPQHTYFLRDDDAMRQTHAWDAKKYPPALGGGYRYESIAAEMAARVRKGGA